MDTVRTHVLVCTGGGCIASGALEVSAALREQIERHGLNGEIKVIESGCLGPCAVGPVAAIYPDGTFYQGLRPDDATEIVEEHLLKGRVVDRLIHKSATGQPESGLHEIGFFKKQVKIVLRNCGVIDPLKIEEYIARDGYQALGKALTAMKPEDVVAEVKKSGLRGRGGAGFLTGLKWEFTRKSPGDVKYILCNGDEGDPGAFMDRSVMEGNPHSVIEGMMIAACAIGADEGYIYVRLEYPLAVARLRRAVADAEKAGILGESVFGSGRRFTVNVMEGAGAFVCGEETALLASIEGKRGMPTPKPPFPAQKGLWGKPTVINNVETLATVPLIMNQGAAAFRRIGTESSPECRRLR